MNDLSDRYSVVNPQAGVWRCLGCGEHVPSPAEHGLICTLRHDKDACLDEPCQRCQQNDSAASGFKVVEKENHLAVHCISWSHERALEWIERYGDSKMFVNKELTKDSFEVIEVSA